MTSSPVSHTEAQLLKRNEKLEQLWTLDDELRDWHLSGDWKQSDPAEVEKYTLKMTDRHILHGELHGMGCAAWEFDPAKDNSGLAIQRHRVKRVVAQ